MSRSRHHSEEKHDQAQAEERPTARRVYIFGRLENEIVLPVIRRLQRLEDRHPGEPIDLYINSSGGNGYNADAIIATMHSITSPVNTICLGHALSGACEVLASGTGKRVAYEFATLMFHQTLWEADGDITHLEIQALQGQRFRDAQIEMLHRVSGQDKRVLRKDIERDHYMSAKEALDYGLIDEIIMHRGVVKHSKATVTAKTEVKVRDRLMHEIQELSAQNKSRKSVSKSSGKNVKGKSKR
jgi:ATP-dependent Clp protease protease subunit